MLFHIKFRPTMVIELDVSDSVAREYQTLATLREFLLQRVEGIFSKMVEESQPDFCCDFYIHRNGVKLDVIATPDLLFAEILELELQQGVVVVNSWQDSEYIPSTG